MFCELDINISWSTVAEASWIKTQFFAPEPLYLYHLHSISLEHLKNVEYRTLQKFLNKRKLI